MSKFCESTYEEAFLRLLKVGTFHFGASFTD